MTQQGPVIITSIRRAVAQALAVAMLLAVGGCGYSLAGRGSFLPEYIKTVGIPLFRNATTVFDLERLLTEQVRSEFIGRGRYRVVPEDTGVDAVLLGQITNVSVAPASFTEERQASRYAIVISARIQFRDLRADKILWENPALQFRDEYEVTTGIDAQDPNAFFGQSSNALDRLAADFSRTVVTAILEAF